MRNKKIILILQGIKLGLETIEIIKEEYRQKRIETLREKVSKEIKRIENRRKLKDFLNI
ncbi:hypothetical protein ES702_05534 [subsurface metagenome]